MATLFKTKKKTKPKIIEINDDFVSEQSGSADRSHDTSHVISSNENTRLIPERESVVINVDNSPSAPPESQVVHTPSGLAHNQRERIDFMAKVYGVLFLQKSSMTLMLVIFRYIPHLRKAVRKLIFDPLFVSSMIGYPMIIVPVILMFVFPKIRRKLYKITFVTLTICLSLLMSYALSNVSDKTMNAFLYSIGSSDLCDLGVIVGSKMKRDFTKWRYIALIPTAMIGSSILGPTILKTPVSTTIWSSILMTGYSTYLAANTVPVIRHNDLKIEPDEYVFAASQLYLNPERAIRHKLSNWFFGSNQRENRGYEAIE